MFDRGFKGATFALHSGVTRSGSPNVPQRCSRVAPPMLRPLESNNRLEHSVPLMSSLVADPSRILVVDDEESIRMFAEKALCASDRLFAERAVLRQDEAFVEKPVTLKGLQQAVSLLLFGHINGPDAGRSPA